MKTEIAVGQNWRLPKGSPWHVVKVGDQAVGLVGPEPRRSYRIVSKLELATAWILVEGAGE
jgi:hypothetical protein